MTVLFTNLASFWPLLALAAVPILVHLFARSRPPVYRFSSVEFIRRVLRHTLRIKRPQDWILLVLRSLLYATILALFLQPIFFANRGLAGMFQRRNVVVIVDATASMAATEGAQSRFGSACAEASEVLAGLSSRDNANVIWLDAAPDSVYPSLGANVDYLQNALRRAKVSSEGGNPEAALIMAGRMLDGVEGRQEICLISDFQKSAWQDISLAVPPGMDMVTVRIGAEPVPNTAVIDVYGNPPRALTGETVSVCCDVQNFSDQPRQCTVYLNTGQTRLSQDIHLLPWQKRTALFQHRPSGKGIQPVGASITDDAFPGDDRRWGLLDVAESLRVGILPLDSATAAVWQRALDALGWARIEFITRQDLDRELPFDIILLAGWAGPVTDSLRHLLADGATVICAPARDLRPSTVLSLVDIPPVPGAPDAPMPWDRAPDPWRIKVTDSRDPVFRLFADGEHGDPTRGTFQARLKLSATSFPGARTLLSYADEVPALLRIDRAGRLLLWNLPLDPEYTSWPRQTEFLMFFGELLLSTRSAVGLRDLLVGAEPGQPLAWPLEREALAADMRLLDREGTPVPLTERRADNRTTFISSPLLRPDLYTWEFQEKSVGHTVVNFPAVESDLRPMSPAEVKHQGAAMVTRGIKIRQLRDGIELWPRLLALGLLLALVEGAILVWVENVRLETHGEPGL
jgi:hypothetical protein